MTRIELTQEEQSVAYNVQPVPRTLKEAAGHYAKLTYDDFCLEQPSERAMWIIIVLMFLSIVAGFVVSYFKGTL